MPELGFEPDLSIASLICELSNFIASSEHLQTDKMVEIVLYLC